jgi:DNA-directed RNA polymerase III subunit RPC6
MEMEGQPGDDEIWKYLLSNPQGSTANDVMAQFPELNRAALVSLLNKLTTEGRAEIFQQPDKTLVWRAVELERVEKFKGLTQEERLVYSLIEKEGNMGLWTRDMKFRSNLQQTTINKILKTLQNRKLIKAVKSIAGRNRKVYMLYDLEPSIKVKGNAFYTPDGQFDSEFVTVLNKHCYLHIEQEGSVTLESMATFIRNSGMSNVELKDEDVQQIIDTLIYDGKVDKVKDAAISIPGRPSYVYKPSRVSPPPNGLTEAPCGQCPVFYMCEDEGDVTPAKCPYLTQWLDTKW